MPHELRSEACANREMARCCQVRAQWARAASSNAMRASVRARDQRRQTRLAIKSIALIAAMCGAGAVLRSTLFFA
jgi:hypothetical protein